MQTIESQLNTKELRRFSADEKYMDRMEKRWEAAEQMIGQLCRNGKPVFYVSPIAGKYREGTKSDLVAFLTRNNYA